MVGVGVGRVDVLVGKAQRGHDAAAQIEDVFGQQIVVEVGGVERCAATIIILGCLVVFNLFNALAGGIVLVLRALLEIADLTLGVGGGGS